MTNSRPQNARVLLVEPHADTAAAVQKLLAREGYDVTIADCADAAMEWLGRESFCLVISDIGLPRVDGLELMRRVRRIYHTPGIAVTGYAAARDRAEALEAGFAEHLAKPVEFNVLLHTIEQLCDPSRAHNRTLSVN